MNGSQSNTQAQRPGPLLVIVGQTATGKTDLAVELAERYGGEIICADSRTVYKRMDIGTAKPTPAERARVAHHCLDIVLPNERFTAADFKRHAQQAIKDIGGRGKLPILVGGTGLYVDAVLYDYTFRGPTDVAERVKLLALSVSELQAKLHRMGVPLPNNPQNPRHLVRAIETGGVAAVPNPLRGNTVVLGLQLDREALLPRISHRVESMLQAGLETEVRILAEQYGFDIPPMQTIGYQEWQGYFLGTQSLELTKQFIIKNTLAYAKRQKTWFKRNNSVHWLDNRDKVAQAVDATTTYLSK